MDTLIKDYEKILKKHRTLETNDPLDRLIAVVSEAKEKIRAATLGKTIKTVSHTISDEQKELQSALSKYSKAIDKKFTAEAMAPINPYAFDNKQHILRKTIALHYIRQGNFEVGDTFAKAKMFDIVAALKENNLEPALHWAKQHSSELEKRSSTLEFKLHRQRFLQLLESQQRLGLDKKLEAILYARANFEKFKTRHEREIARLMCSILYRESSDSSLYSDLMAASSTDDIQHMFTRDFCRLIGLSCESPLYVSLTVGTQAMPTIIKMATIMKAKKTEWSQQSEMPVEIALTDDTKFHSIFACPVSKEQATEDNPPMMMACGHVICKESILRLCRNNNTQRFKCPYCPTESTFALANNVFF
ncbi:hypothetical protein BGX31_005923 [Mortierella sp. GBA43]|nr:hypothetical protein BGX31_005923 [Mortierella sp. GBA43]